MTPDREPRFDKFGDSDDLELLGLGALGWLDKFAVALAPRAPDAAAAPEALVSAALGLMSLRRTLNRWAVEAQAQPAPPPRATGAPEGLLR